MIDEIAARLKQKKRTVAFPKGPPVLPELLRGLPSLDGSKCVRGCDKCVEACPAGAVRPGPALSIDLGKCLFCAGCARACGTGAITFTTEARLCAGKREDLIYGGGAPRLAGELTGKRAVLKRSLKLRQVSAGGCNACEADINVLSTVVFDLGRFGIQFVASPRHADGIVVTGPVTKNMLQGLMKTYEAVPSPKVVIAVGACAISGGPFAGHGEVENGLSSLLPVDLFIPGCPPHPITILDGFLRLTGRIGPGA